MEFLPLLLMGVAFYFLLIRPQQKKQKAHAEMLSKVAAGDEIVTSSGIYGAVAEVDGDAVWVEVAPEVELKILKSAVADIVSADEETADAEDAADEASDSADENTDA